MIRLNDWDERLTAHISAAEGAEFVWGKTDCFQFVAGAVEAVSGVNFMAGVKYKTMKEAMVCMTKGATIKGKKVKGPKTTEAWLTKHLGEPESTPEGYGHGAVALLGEHATGVDQAGETVTLERRPGLATPGVIDPWGNVLVRSQDRGLIRCSVLDCTHFWQSEAARTLTAKEVISWQG